MSNNSKVTKYSKDNPTVELASKDNATRSTSVAPPVMPKEQKRK